MKAKIPIIIDVKELGKERAKELCVKAVQEFVRDLDMESRYQLVENHMLCKNIDDELIFYRETLKGFADVRTEE